MTPKEKAIELFDKMYWHFRTLADTDICKQCALIAVDEMLDFMFLSENENSFWINYYNKVKQEINLL